MLDRRALITLPSARALAVDIFAPPGEACGQPIVFSHGANAAPDRYRALLDGWVAAGHVVIAPLHLDSEDHPDRETQDRGRVLRTRIEDMATVLHAITAGGLPGLNSTAAAGVIAAGHSYGAYIAQIMAGATALDPADGKLLFAPDISSVRAVIALSPPPAFAGFSPRGSWEKIGVPMLVQTGTTDIMPPFVAEWAHHLDSYREGRPGATIGCVYNAVDHYFGGMIGRVDPAATPSMQAQFDRFVRLSTRFMQDIADNVAQFRERPDLAALCDRFLSLPHQDS